MNLYKIHTMLKLLDRHAMKATGKNIPFFDQWKKDERSTYSLVMALWTVSSSFGDDLPDDEQDQLDAVEEGLLAEYEYSKEDVLLLLEMLENTMLDIEVYELIPSIRAFKEDLDTWMVAVEVLEDVADKNRIAPRLEEVGYEFL